MDQGPPIDQGQELSNQVEMGRTQQDDDFINISSGEADDDSGDDEVAFANTNDSAQTHTESIAAQDRLLHFLVLFWAQPFSLLFFFFGGGNCFSEIGDGDSEKGVENNGSNNDNDVLAVDDVSFWFHSF